MVMRTFETGATRNDAGNKFDYEGFLSPLALERFGEYMHSHRLQKDGSIRDSDNWQKGIPRNQYMKSLIRHVFDLWKLHRGHKATNPDTGDQFTKDELLSAILFNAQGYLHEVMIMRDAGSLENWYHKL